MLHKSFNKIQQKSCIINKKHPVIIAQEYLKPSIRLASLAHYTEKTIKRVIIERAKRAHKSCIRKVSTIIICNLFCNVSKKKVATTTKKSCITYVLLCSFFCNDTKTIERRVKNEYVTHFRTGGERSEPIHSLQKSLHHFINNIL